MTVWAIADLHLSLGVPNKKMDIFGKNWEGHADKIASSWKAVVDPHDLVLLAGDISWAMTLDQVKSDLQWIEDLPGTKIMIRGNHDYWWGSINSVRAILPPSCHVIQNDAFAWEGLSIGGSRLWDTDEYHFDEYIAFTGERKIDPHVENEKIFNRELGRLELSLKAMDQKAEKRIVMTHYPPIGPDLIASAASKMLEKYNVDIVVFGHLHNVKKPLFEKQGKIKYYLTACDYLNFKPLRIV